jgi:hypothetical protein
MKRNVSWIAIGALLLTACASKPPEPPYPAFVEVGELDDVFLASLPGVRAKPLAGDPQTRRASNRIDLPEAWRGTSGGEPGRSMEIFVLEGDLSLADIKLGPGGYAFLPAGSLGFNLSTDQGARILYFVNDVDPESIIRSPILIDANLLEWEATGTPGIAIKELRKDPGNGARTWLLRIAPGSTQSWQSSSVLREGYLVDGDYWHSECVGGEVATGQYLSGGYFYRPGGAVNGGPDSRATTESTWLLREVTGGEVTEHDGCSAPSP